MVVTQAPANAGVNVVDVLVTLNNLVFHDQGLESFAFNISGNPSLTQVTTLGASGQLTIINGGGSTWTLTHPAGNTDGAGSTFGYSLDCTAGAGACVGSPSTLEFQIELTGLTPAGLETLSGAVVKQGKNLVQTTTNVDFAANVANGACTGEIGAGSGTGQSTPQTTGKGTTTCGTAVPEPGTLLLVGFGLLGLSLGAFGRRKWMARRRAVA